MRVAVMGSGSWGTAMAKVLCEAGADVQLWARRESLVATINSTGRNGDYLPDVDLPKSLRANSNAAEVVRGAELVVCAVPSQSLRASLAQWRPDVADDAIFVSLAKGIEITTLKRMSEVIAEVTGAPADRVAVLTGPNLAREIADGKPAATVVACADHQVAQRIQSYCSTKYFRPYTNTDVVGCEVGGAVKNVIALSCGMAAGAGLGENAIASLITRGLAETTRLGIALGAKAETFAGLAGVGDLVATCTSPLSRNRSFGIRLGEGRSLDEAQAATNGQVAEGVKSCTSVQALARQVGVDMPLTDAVHAVCHDGLSVPEAVVALLGRTTKPE